MCAPGVAVLTTAGKPSSRAAATASSGAGGEPLGHDRDAVGLEQRARVLAASSHASSHSASTRATTSCAALTSMPSSCGTEPAEPRSHSARSAARPSARAADSGYANEGMFAALRSVAGAPSAARMQASTVFSGWFAAATASLIASPTLRAGTATGGTKSRIAESIPGSASRRGTVLR